MRPVPQSTVRRLSLYLRCLEELRDRGASTVSSRELAERAGTTSAQVRKDLSYFGSFGKRGLGYAVSELEGELREILGLDRTWGVAIVGAGRIGLALARYPNFERKGFDVRALFDNDPAKVGRRRAELEVRDVEELPDAIEELEIEIIIIATPEEVAQDVADMAVSAGVRAILNFAPVKLQVPAEVVVNDVNMVPELEHLSFALSHGRGANRIGGREGG